MMNVGDLSLEDLGRCLQGDGAAIRSGSFITRIQTNLPELAAPIKTLYQDFPLLDGPVVTDYQLVIKSRARWRHGGAPYAELRFDGVPLFQPFERPLALAYLEWGLNHCIYSNAHQFLIFHAAVVDQNGSATLLAGRPGSGKSTLCAGLVHRGWRLLSDELALLRPQDLEIIPLARAISLKNQSIEIIKAFAPDAEFGPQIKNTQKGTIAHLRPPRESIKRINESSRATRIIFPKYVEDAEIRLQLIPKARAFFGLAENAFNYDILGAQAFRLTCKLIDACECYQLNYSSLEAAIDELDQL